MKRTLFLIIGMLLATSLISQAREKYSRDDALQDVKILREGNLVVRLESDKRKLDILEERAKGLSGGQKDQVLDQIADIKAIRDSFNLNLIRAFHENYKFSSVYFIYDYDAKRFLDGARDAIFLNRSGKIDGAIEWTEKPFLGLRSGEAKGGPQGLIMTDDSFNDLPDPFPGFISRNSLGSIFKWLLARDIYWRNNAERMVEKLNNKLFNFLN